MRLLFPFAIILAAAPLPARPALQQAADCPGISSRWVRDGRTWQSKPLRPQRLTDLPPAERYAAIYRLDERGCMVPVKFRDVRR